MTMYGKYNIFFTFIHNHYILYIFATIRYITICKAYNMYILVQTFMIIVSLKLEFGHSVYSGKYHVRSSYGFPNSAVFHIFRNNSQLGKNALTFFIHKVCLHKICRYLNKTMLQSARLFYRYTKHCNEKQSST